MKRLPGKGITEEKEEDISTRRDPVYTEVRRIGRDVRKTLLRT